MTPVEAAARLGCKSGLVYKLCAAGRLGHASLGFGRGVIRISDDDPKAYVEPVRVHPVSAAVPDVPKAVAGRRPAVRDYVGEWQREREQKKRRKLEGES